MQIFDLFEENELDTYISGEVRVPEGDEAKILTQEELGQGKKSIDDSIMNHLIPQLSYLNTPKEMFDSLIKLIEG